MRKVRSKNRWRKVRPKRWDGRQQVMGSDAAEAQFRLNDKWNNAAPQPWAEELSGSWWRSKGIPNVSQLNHRVKAAPIFSFFLHSSLLHSVIQSSTYCEASLTHSSQIRESHSGMLELSRNFPGSLPGNELRRARKMERRASIGIPTGHLVFLLWWSFPWYVI